MQWDDKRYYSLNTFLRSRHGQKVMKLSLDGGFTCPNRDGKLSTEGCIFCSDRGSGDFAASCTLPISKQIESAADLLKNKWSSGKYIAYFQAYTNTYAPVSVLRKKFTEALSQPNVVGIAIATRPDCLSDDIIDLLHKISLETHLWVELGLQSIHSDSAALIRRGYDLDCFDDAVKRLRSRNIETVVHLILGLPYETKLHVLETIKYISQFPLQGVKLHLLHVLSNTPLAEFYYKKQFPLLTQETYIDWVISCLEHLPPTFVIHRLTGDGAKKDLIGPSWSKNKRNVLNEINKQLKLRQTYQSRHYN